MHRLRSKSAVLRFRLAAFLVCAKYILFPIGVGALIYSILLHEKLITLIAMGVICLAALAMIFRWVIGSRTNCPLCITPVLSNSHCMKSKHAKTFLGSHRLRVSLAILFTNSFRCPYCDEPTSVEVRQRRQPHYSRS